MGASETRRSARRRGASRRVSVRAARDRRTCDARIGARRAETLNGALVKAYLINPDINAQRAQVRQTDESVPEANAGYLPKISAVRERRRSRTRTAIRFSPAPRAANTTDELCPRHVSAQIRRPGQSDHLRRLPDDQQDPERGIAGARRARATAQHRAEHAAGRPSPRIWTFCRTPRSSNSTATTSTFCKEQLRETNDRFTVGEVTRTDVAQAEASLAERQRDPAHRPGRARSLGRHLSAGDRRRAQDARAGQAARQAAAAEPCRRRSTSRRSNIRPLSPQEHGVDVALLSIKSPKARSIRPGRPVGPDAASISTSTATPGQRAFVAQITGQLTIPIYQGGAEYANIRQTKEGLSVQELKASSTKDQIRQNVVAAWGRYQAAIGVVKAARASVAANEVALAGVREEAKVGQRTTLDVLNAQQALLSARTQLVRARTRSGRVFLFAAVDDRPAERADAWACGRRVRSIRPLRPGQEQVDRTSDARRQIAVDDWRAARGACRWGGRRYPDFAVRDSAVRIVCARAAIGVGARRPDDLSRRVVETEAIGMSAVNLSASDREHDALRRAQKAHEPSMEEILASIRTIIAEEREPGEDVGVKDPAPRPSRRRAGCRRSSIRRANPADAAAGPARQQRADAPLEADRAKGRVAAGRPTAAAASATAGRRRRAPGCRPLRTRRSPPPSTPCPTNLAARSAELAEELAREMLRPMLKAWLDDNLPAIVERLVRAEIERVARGSR